MGDREGVSGWAQWVEASTGKTLTSFQVKAVDVLCAGFGSPWNAPWRWENVNWTSGYGVSVCASGTPSTYDNDQLTRLVIAAHEECVRVSVAPATPRRLRISLHPRVRDGSIMDRHPTIEEATASFRARFGLHGKTALASPVGSPPNESAVPPARALFTERV